MKKLKYILVLIALGFMNQSCVQDEKDLFEDSAAQRMNKAVSEYSDLLESSENGWVMDFYPSDGSMGGYTQTVSFKNGVAAIASEISLSNSSTGEAWPAGTVLKSLYQVKGEQECILTFDSYNVIFHFWSEPKGSSSPTGYESDYEFAFKQVSNDTIILKGKHYGNRMQLTRLTKPSDEYIKNVLAMAEKDSPRLEVIAGGKSFDCVMREKQFTYTVKEATPASDTEEATEAETETIPYVYTEDGIRLYKPITINGITFQNLTLGADDVLTAVGADVKIPKATQIQLFRAGALTGYFNVDFEKDNASMDDNFWSLTKKAYDDNLDYWDEEIRTMFIGAAPTTSAKNPVCLGWGSYYSATGKYLVLYGISMDFTSENEVDIKGLGADLNFTYYTYFTPMVNYVLNNSPYSVENIGTEDEPVMKFTSKADSKVWFSVSL